MPEGVGVKGGGLVGDGEGAALRFLGRGVEGRCGIAKSDFVVSLGPLMVGEVVVVCGDAAAAADVAGALVLRFFGAAAGLVTFW